MFSHQLPKTQAQIIIKHTCTSLRSTYVCKYNLFNGMIYEILKKP